MSTCKCGNPSGRRGTTSPIDTVDTCWDCGEIIDEKKQPSKRPPVHFQGKIEVMESSVRGIFLVIFPGRVDVELYRGKRAAERAIKNWAKANARDAINVALSEWGAF